VRAAKGGIRGFVSGRVSVRDAGDSAGYDGYVQEGMRGIGKANPISRELGLAEYCLLTPRWAYVFYKQKRAHQTVGSFTFDTKQVLIQQLPQPRQQRQQQLQRRQQPQQQPCEQQLQLQPSSEPRDEQPSRRKQQPWLRYEQP